MSEQEQLLNDPAGINTTETPMETEYLGTAPPTPAAGSSDTTQSPSTIDIRMKTLNDRETTVNISPWETIQTLVQQGRAQLGITVGFQRIIFQGRVLAPDQTISSASIQHGHTVHLVDRSPGGLNDQPTLQNAFPNALNIGEIVVRQMARDVRAIGESGFVIVPPVRFPGEINHIPVIAARRAQDMLHQDISPIANREGSSRIIVHRSDNPLPFNRDPQQLSWRFRVIDNLMYRPREQIEKVIKETIDSIPFVEPNTRALFQLKWNEDFSEIRIEMPAMPPHVPSPALEKLDFLCLWTDFLKKSLDKLEESDGLIAAVQQVLEMATTKQTTDGLSQNEREVRMTALDEIVKHLELLSTELSHMKDFERDRFKKNSSESYRRMKLEEFAETELNPRYVMRHALDVDLTVAMREFRKQQRRVSVLEDLMDDAMDAGAIKYVRDTMSNNQDYRYQALTMFFHYMQRIRHQLSHMVHVSSELDVSFLMPGHPQRLLPQYATNSLRVPVATAGTLIIKFVTARSADVPCMVPLNTILEPPRRCSDVGDRVNGDWPIMAIHPPSVSLEAVMAPPRRVEARQAPFLSRIARRGDQGAAITIEGVIDTENVELMPVLGMAHGIETGRMRIMTQPRRIVTTGDAPSVPVETQPPPGEQQPGPSNAGQQPEAGVPVFARRPRTQRFNVQPDARGPETATLAALPVPIEPNELQRIAKNIASRYRAEALQRIASNLTDRFRQESWDTRIQSLPLCTLRECVALALEMLASAGPTINDSRDLMLALVREEEVLIRAITECVKSLFGRGEFPTHVSRIIMPRAEVASSRNDYESVDGVEESQSDELEAMIVRMPSDISQPQSGDLRAIRDRRASRRQFLESHPPPQLSASASTNPPGPSFNPEDEAEIRAGRLPLSIRRGRGQREFGGRPAGGVNSRVQRSARGGSRPQSPGHAATLVAASTGQGPSTTARISPHPGLSLSFTASSHSFIPVRSENVPSPAGSSSSSVGPSMTPNNEPISGVWMQNIMTTQSPSPPPSHSSQTTSAPATVTSSPVHSEPVREDTDSPLALARAAAREARARIDHLAANFTGNLSETRQASPFNPTSSGPPTDPRRRVTRPQPFGALNPGHRPMVAIDPFMNCTSRHCEMYRLQNPDAIPDSDRYTLLSNQPDPEFIDHVNGQGLRPTFERRPVHTSDTDEDYNYEVQRNVAGDFGFPDLTTFKKFIRTSLRSLLAQCIDTDSLVTLNMSSVSGHPAVSSLDMANAVRRHAGSTNLLYGLRPNMMPYRANGVETQLLPARHAVFQTEDLRRQQAFRLVADEYGGDYRQFDREVLTPGQVATSLSYLVDYMETATNPRPTGLFALLLSLTVGRLSRHEFSQLSRRVPCREILEEYQAGIANQIRSDYLDHRTNLDNSELHQIADRLANDESFYSGFMSQNQQMAHSFTIGTDEVFVVWAFRQIEVALIKSILTLGSSETLSTENVVRYTMEAFDTYLYRNLMMFYRIAGRHIGRQRTHMRRVSDYVATLRFGANAPTTSVINAFIDEWNHIIDYWYDQYNTAEVHEGPFTYFLINARAGTGWNDIPGYGTASEVTNATSPYTSLFNSISTSQSRKRNHNGSHRSVDGVDAVPTLTSPSAPAQSTVSEGPSSSSSSAAPTSSNEEGVELAASDSTKN